MGGLLSGDTHNDTIRFEFWGDSNSIKALDLKKGVQISLKTKGDSILIEICANISEHNMLKSKGYSGENVGKSWTDSISAVKQTQEEKKLPGANIQGADDSEWD